MSTMDFGRELNLRFSDLLEVTGSILMSIQIFDHLNFPPKCRKIPGESAS